MSLELTPELTGFIANFNRGQFAIWRKTMHSHGLHSDNNKFVRKQSMARRSRLPSGQTSELGETRQIKCRLV
jgi:hypothetical protein